MGDWGEELPAAGRGGGPGRHVCTCAGGCECTRAWGTHVCLQSREQHTHTPAALLPGAEPKPQGPCPGSMRSPGTGPAPAAHGAETLPLRALDTSG